MNDRFYKAAAVLTHMQRKSGFRPFWSLVRKF